MCESSQVCLVFWNFHSFGFSDQLQYIKKEIKSLKYRVIRIFTVHTLFPIGILSNFACLTLCRCTTLCWWDISMCFPTSGKTRLDGFCARSEKLIGRDHGQECEVFPSESTDSSGQKWRPSSPPSCERHEPSTAELLSTAECKEHISQYAARLCITVWAKCWSSQDRKCFAPHSPQEFWFHS